LGDDRARILVVGLAPAAHGGNRTGRMFTGDESGNFLFRALFEAGLANRPESWRRGDGLRLSGALVSAACRCAPPGNKPLPEELDNCREYLERELALLPPGTVLVALGGLAFAACLKVLARAGSELPRPRPKFAHGAEYRIGGHVLLASYHPSQQNTFTGKLTRPMLRAVLRRAVKEARPET
jgi:uracil-DNA glycosylase family 4